MEATKIVKSSQEQAVASWVNYLNQVRLDRLMEALRNEEANLNNALSTVNETLKTISRDIVNNGQGRGGECGMHGFIAEVAECGIGNARSQVEGKVPIYEWINDNGPEDLRRGATLIQQKFVQSGNHLSLQAVREHLRHYPDFIDNGGKYQIPADHYEKIKWLLSIPKEEANKMPTSTGEFSMSQWREVHDFFSSGEVPLDSVEPSALDYRGVQRGTYEHTLDQEKASLTERSQERRDAAYQESKPSFGEGAKATVAAAAIEGGMVFCLDIIQKKKEGKAIRDFDSEDWKEISGDTGVGVVKGGIRGASIYLLTNYTATPAAVANGIVTASFGVAEQANLFRKGEINKLEFIDNTESVCLDATVSAISSFAGQALIPIPILGAIIGNAVGTMMYQIAKDNLSVKEQKIMEEYLESIRVLDEDMKVQYQAYLDQIEESMRLFMDVLDKAFAPDVRIAFTGSVQLAKAVGVPSEEILDSRDKITAYFMD